MLDDSTKPYIFRFGERFRSVVLQIPRPVGFKDPSHFSRAFRTRYGISPARYRRTAATPA
ncbi:helix-turn-helix domain-containing protein [Nonomuraea sp. NPDC049480]|uniref:helix-turn-helix domain-containing protein n=1 Tax=Nonomuraea sp. NPDC049480 TaxID=3364353 RepID=UPI0037A3EAEB